MSANSISSTSTAGRAHQEEHVVSKSLWGHAWETLTRDKIAVFSLVIVSLYFAVGLLSASGLIAADWAKEIGEGYQPPSLDSVKHWFGTDIFGRSVLLKTIKGTEIAMSVGLAAGLISISIGVFLGAIAGYYGGKVDEVIVWFYTTFSSIPGIMLLMAFAFAFGKRNSLRDSFFGTYDMGNFMSFDSS